MSSQLTFNEVVEKHSKTLELYVPIVARVHGGTHPEFHKVHALYDAMIGKIKEAGSNIPEIQEELSELRKITDDYTVPEDTCESYEAVYNMLAKMDQAYGA